MRLIDWLVARAPRERVLLALLVALALPAALALGLLLPLQNDRRAAAAALEEAAALNAWIRDRQREMAGLAGAAPEGPEEPDGPVGASALEQSLVAARLRPRLSALETDGEGGIVLRFDEVAFTELMGWIDDQAPGWGYRIAALGLERSDTPAMVAARLVLAPEG